MIIFLTFCLTWIRCEENCNLLPSWFQQDKCRCDKGLDQYCDVYCKQPYLDLSICKSKSARKDEWLCKYLSDSDACERYCNNQVGKTKQDECKCVYVSYNHCSVYCNTNDKTIQLECGCKYHAFTDDNSQVTQSQTTDCYNYCSPNEGDTPTLENLNCQCKYLSDSVACQSVCERKDDPFSRYECLCLLEREKGEDGNNNCTHLADIIKDSIKYIDVVETNGTNETEEDKKAAEEAIEAAEEALSLSKCYYEKDIGRCNEYCESFFNDSDSIGSCKCSKYNDKDSCVRQCDIDNSDDAHRLFCKCNVDANSSYCIDYCYATYVNGTKDNETDIFNKDLQECLCQYGSTHNSKDDSVNYSPSCRHFCTLVFEGDNSEEKEKNQVFCNNYCTAQTTEGNPDGQSICLCDVLKEPRGCQVYCKNISISEPSDKPEEKTHIGKCRSYCNSLEWVENIAYCLCNYSIDPFLCRDYCQGGKYVQSMCRTYCNSLTVTDGNITDNSKTLLCECNFINNTKCQNFCLTMEPESARQDCFCDFGDDASCNNTCQALGREGRVVDKARCMCRSRLNITSCSDYCDMSLAGHANSAQLQDKCKCDYQQGDEYCTRYSQSLPDKEHLHYDCTVRGDKQACYEYCLNHVNVLKNNTETYKCWCEIYGDVTWCPVYCDSLNSSHPDSLRCKCLHFNDDPSCEQYCATIPAGTPAREECACTILREAEGAEKDMSPQGHYQGCVAYCRSRPTYGERIECSCKYKLDQARCAEIGNLKKGAGGGEDLQSERYWPLCQIWNGKAHELNCRYYCNWKQTEAAEEAIRKNSSLNATEIKQLVRPVRLQCYCDIVRSREACILYCNENYPNGEDNTSKGLHSKCLCEHASSPEDCKGYCDLLYPPIEDPRTAEEYKQQARNAECKCDAIQFFTYNSSDYINSLANCETICTRNYGEKEGEEGASLHLPFHSCFVLYDKLNVNSTTTFCEQFRDLAMRTFCMCFYNPNSEHCSTYCDVLDQVEKEREGEEEEEEEEAEGDGKGEGEKGDPLPVVPMKDMCRCFWGDDQACGVFCNPATFSASLCRKSCSILADDENRNVEYMDCLCVSGVASGCKGFCDQYFGNDMDKYYECRCTHKLDLLSCVHYCGNLPNRTEAEDGNGENSTEVETREACMDARVFIGPGALGGKGRYVDDYNKDDWYVFRDLAPSEEEEEEEEKEPIKQEAKREGWWENKTNRLIVIICGSVFVAAVVVAVILIIVVWKFCRKNPETKEVELESMPAVKRGHIIYDGGKADENNLNIRSEPSYVPDYNYEEEKKKNAGKVKKNKLAAAGSPSASPATSPAPTPKPTPTPTPAPNSPANNVNDTPFE